MRAALIVVTVATLTSACAPIHGYGLMSHPRGWPNAPVAGPSLNLATVTGRWDNVMMLPAGARVVVLHMDGTQAEGDVVAASATSVTLAVASGRVEIAADAVARVDRLGATGRLRRSVSGAAHGAGAVGLIGLIAGTAPPARLFAAGAIAGAEAGAHAPVGSGPQIVYLATQIRR